MNLFQRMKFRKGMKKHMNRPLDLNEILFRETNANVVVDAYEYFMRQCQWNLANCVLPEVRIFVLCVLYDGEIANGGISQFLANSSGDYAHQTADALHTIGALDAEVLLRKSFALFANGIVPKDKKIRNLILDEMDDAAEAALEQLDLEVYEADIHGFCHQYLMGHKDQFLASK